MKQSYEKIVSRCQRHCDSWRSMDRGIRYTGKQIEQHMGEVVDNANGQLKAYLPKAGVKLSYENYQRGLFSSKVRYVLRSDGTDTSENAALKTGEEVAFPKPSITARSPSPS